MMMVADLRHECILNQQYNISLFFWFAAFGVALSAHIVGYLEGVGASMFRSASSQGKYCAFSNLTGTL
jgi:hypothetical protein